MNNRALAYVSLLAVIGVSIVFGMLIGGRLNAPQFAMAAPSRGAVELAPAQTVTASMTDFADIVEAAMPAVVSVVSTRVPGEEGEGDEDEGEGRRSPSREDLWRWFFGPDDPDHPDPRREPSIGQGSGFIISQDGYVLTNNHVVEQADEVEVALQSGEEFKARVVGTDPSIDLALLKIDNGRDPLPVLPLGDSSELRVGEWVIAIGNPHEFDHTVTVGVVSGKERRVPIGGTDSGVVSFIQTDAAINLGNSGGPLLDSRGNVVGINTAIRRANFAEGIGFALPINQARGVIEQLRDRGYVRRGYIGITMNRDGIDDTAMEYLGLPDDRGVIIDDVTEGGPAERAGVRRDDVIREVDGQPVRDNLDLISKISSHQPGDTVKLEIFRKGKTLQLDATLEDRDEGLRAQNQGVRDPRRREEPEPEAASTGLGITVEALTDETRERFQLEQDQHGVRITDVEFNSTAADKGVLRNMVVVGINGKPVRGLSAWNDIIESLESGDAVKLDLLAGPRQVTVFLRVPEAE
jgi:serine protease Do